MNTIKTDDYENLKKKLEALELVATYAQDLVTAWPLFSFRTVRLMCAKVDSLKQALDLLK